MVHTTKFYLIYDDEESPICYEDFCKEMFNIQRCIRLFKNTASAKYFCYILDREQRKKDTGHYPTDEEMLGNKFANILYRLACNTIPTFYTINANSVSREVQQYFKNRYKDILSGAITIPSYKSNQPINLHNRSIVLKQSGDEVSVTLSLLSSARKKELGLKTCMFRFKVWHKCGSSVQILRRCLTGEYKIAESLLQYDKTKRMWELALSYHFDSHQDELNPNRILGVDLGVCLPAVAAVSDSRKRLIIRGSEVASFRHKTEAMRRDFAMARPYAGDGSVGHGRSGRNKPVDRIGSRIANFRNTKNHAWAREIVKFAVKNHCGTIQMEDLSGISSGSNPKFLKNWTYFDLQQKIIYKSKAEGISVSLVDPAFTSQRCSQCGHIAATNRQTQDKFVCQSCGFTENADYNAARNLACAGIEQIIESTRT